MTDTFTQSERSRIMAAVKSKDTGPEMVVRRMVHALGFRYRLHVSSLPGSPDLVFPARKKVVFVHGCFWHRHRCDAGRSMPTTKTAYWKAKFERNRLRDRKNRRRLRRLGWKTLVIWECQTTPRNLPRLKDQVARFLASPNAPEGNRNRQIKMRVNTHSPH